MYANNQDPLIKSSKTHPTTHITPMVCHPHERLISNVLSSRHHGSCKMDGGDIHRLLSSTWEPPLPPAPWTRALMIRPRSGHKTSSPEEIKKWVSPSLLPNCSPLRLPKAWTNWGRRDLLVEPRARWTSGKSRQQEAICHPLLQDLDCLRGYWRDYKYEVGPCIWIDHQRPITCPGYCLEGHGPQSIIISPTRIRRVTQN